jgi:hypothetical protein
MLDSGDLSLEAEDHLRFAAVDSAANGSFVASTFVTGESRCDLYQNNLALLKRFAREATVNPIALYRNRCIVMSPFVDLASDSRPYHPGESDAGSRGCCSGELYGNICTSWSALPILSRREPRDLTINNGQAKLEPNHIHADNAAAK